MVNDAFRQAWSDYGPAGLIGGVIGLFVGLAFARTLVTCAVNPFTGQELCDKKATFVVAIVAAGGTLLGAILVAGIWSSLKQRHGSGPPST